VAGRADVLVAITRVLLVAGYATQTAFGPRIG
jgi:hypothetical protein